MRYLLLMLFFSTSALAEWIPLKLVSNSFYDNSSVELMTDMKFRVYTYTNLPQSQMKSIEMQIEFDCRDRSYRDLVQTFYMEKDLKGEKIGNTKLDTSVKYPPRDTNIESILSEICVNVLAPDKVPK